MSRQGGSFYIDKDKDDQSGSTTTSEHHFRARVNADHYEGTNTPYYELPNEEWKRLFVSGWFTEDPVSPYGTETYFEEYRATVEIRDGDSNDTETRNPEPDPNEYNYDMLFDLSVSVGFGPVSLSHSVKAESMSHTDNYQNNLYWHHWEIPNIDMPIGTDDAHGASVNLDTRLPAGDSVKAAGWNSGTYSYTDPSWAGTAFQDTDVLGGFANFDVVSIR